MTSDNSFGKMLRYLRKKNQRSLKGVADFLGISVSYLSDVERGRRQPFDINMILEISRHFGVCANELIFEAAMSRRYIPLHKQSKSQVIKAIDILYPGTKPSDD